MSPSHLRYAGTRPAETFEPAKRERRAAMENRTRSTAVGVHTGSGRVSGIERWLAHRILRAIGGRRHIRPVALFPERAGGAGAAAAAPIMRAPALAEVAGVGLLPDQVDQSQAIPSPNYRPTQPERNYTIVVLPRWRRIPQHSAR